LIWYLASTNKDKLKELEEVVNPFGIELKFPLYENISFDVAETGDTLRENALIKAEYLYKIVKKPVISDDTGLFVDYLDGMPGVFSSRFAGEKATYLENRKKLLSLLQGIPFHKRSAKFKTVICLYMDGETHFFEGQTNGFITTEERGDSGFGYDSIFLYPPLGKTFGEIPLYLKNRISHRGKAIKALLDFLEKFHGKSNIF